MGRAMRETFQQFVARVNANAYLADEPLTGVQIMAKAVKLKKGAEFTFTSGGGQASKYPWDEWFGGELLLLERSEGTENAKGTIEAPTVKKDFDVAVDAMPAKLKTAARRRYKVVQISRKDADGNKLKDGLIIRARDMDADERAAEDLLRAEEKAARKEKGEDSDDDAPSDTPSTGDPTAAPAGDTNAA